MYLVLGISIKVLEKYPKSNSSRYIYMFIGCNISITKSYNNNTSTNNKYKLK